MSHTASGVVTIYNYDNNGNTISTYVGGNFAGGYTYDLFNRQKTYTPDGTVFTTTTYRPDGLRHSIGTTKHIWDAGNIVGDITGSTYKQYFRALNLIYSLIGTTKQYYRYNGHGDVVALTNATGTVTKTYTYNAFGEEQNIDNLDANPFRYCGEYFDKVSGTLYLRARNYNASIGRFTQEDPVRDGGNWYSYCSGNPINCFDPTGLFNWGKLLQGVIAVTVGVVALVASIATLGAATPLVAVALMGIACAGTVSTYCGLYDIQEAETGENKLKDEMNDMLGDRAYELIESVAVGTSTFGVGLILSNPGLFNQTVETSQGETYYRNFEIEEHKKEIFSELNVEKSMEHMFSEDHLRDGIMNLGNSKEDIFDNVCNIIESVSPLWEEGSNEIRTVISGIAATIRFFVEEGKVININSFVDFSDRIIGNLINLIN